MLLRRLLLGPGDLCKLACQPRKLTLGRGFSSISSDSVSSSSRDKEDDDFFGITEKDLYNESKTFQTDNSPPSNNEDGFSKEELLTKHLSKPDCSEKSDPVEKYISTKFGKIRFDWQNTATTAPPKVRRDISSIKMKESNRSNDNMDYISEMYFGETLENSTTTVVSNRSIGDINPEFSIREDNMDFINSQYFNRENVSSSNYAQSHDFSNPSNSNSVNLEDGTPHHDNVQQPFGLENNSSTKIHFNNSDSNFIDSQYFDNTLHVESDSKSVNNLHTDPFQHPFDLKKNSSNKVNLSNNDSNFIDSQYFDNTLHVESVNNSVNLGDSHHDHFQRQHPFDLEKNSSKKVNFTSDNVIESQYFDNNNTLHVESDSNASTTNRTKAEKGPRQNANPKSETETAFEASQKIRREIKKKNEGTLVDSKGFRILKTQVNDLTNLTTYEIANHLKTRILYNKNDLLVIDKPYGLPSHGGPGINVNIAKALPELAKKIYHSGDIHLVHRLDKETTGVMLLAKTDKMAHTLKYMFEKRQVIKTYWALTKGIPNPSRGVIDIPIAEGSVDGKHRMVLQPEYTDLKKSRVSSHQAITHYKILQSSFKCALVECKTETGIKHQVRVHLAFGLNTPILGDHKYSHLTKMAPQRLFPEILDCLRIRQSKARHVPMHLHAVSMILPEVINGRNFVFKAPLPYHFRDNMKSLKFKKP